MTTEQYTRAELQITEFDTEDVITSSGDTPVYDNSDETELT